MLERSPVIPMLWSVTNDGSFANKVYFPVSVPYLTKLSEGLSVLHVIVIELAVM